MNHIPFLDIDECLTNPCDANANCNNTDGSYGCTCHLGYEGNGTYCSGTVLCHYKLPINTVYF